MDLLNQVKRSITDPQVAQDVVELMRQLELLHDMTREYTMVIGPLPINCRKLGSLYFAYIVLANP